MIAVDPRGEGNQQSLNTQAPKEDGGQSQRGAALKIKLSGADVQLTKESEESPYTDSVNPLREIGSVKWFRRMRQTAHSKYISSEEESHKTTEITYLFRRFRKVESRSNSPARRDISLEAVEAGVIKMDDIVRIFRIGGIDCLTPDQIASLFDPDWHATTPRKMNPN